MILDPQVIRLASWFASLQSRVGEVLSDKLENACISQLGLVSGTLQDAAQSAQSARIQATGIGLVLTPDA